MNKTIEGGRNHYLRGQEGYSDEGNLITLGASFALIFAFAVSNLQDSGQKEVDKANIPEGAGKAPIVTVDEQEDTITCEDIKFEGKVFDGRVVIKSPIGETTVCNFIPTGWQPKDSITCDDVDFNGKTFGGSVEIYSNKIEDAFSECHFPAK